MHRPALTATVHDLPVPAQGRARVPRHRACLDALGRLVSWIADEIWIRRNMRELMTFDDRMLADIGVDRGRIEHVVRTGLCDISGTLWTRRTR